MALIFLPCTLESKKIIPIKEKYAPRSSQLDDD
jgi:hypothetical protein